MPGERAPTVADLDMAMEDVARAAHIVRMIALRVQIDALNMAVPCLTNGQIIAGRLLWEPLGMYAPAEMAY